MIGHTCVLIGQLLQYVKHSAATFCIMQEVNGFNANLMSNHIKSDQKLTKMWSLGSPRGVSDPDTLEIGPTSNHGDVNAFLLQMHTKSIWHTFCTLWNNTVWMNELFKACLFGIIQKRCYLPVYLHALMAAEEWEAGERSEKESVG